MAFVSKVEDLRWTMLVTVAYFFVYYGFAMFVGYAKTVAIVSLKRRSAPAARTFQSCNCSPLTASQKESKKAAKRSDDERTESDSAPRPRIKLTLLNLRNHDAVRAHPLFVRADRCVPPRGVLGLRTEHAICIRMHSPTHRVHRSMLNMLEQMVR